MSIAFSRLAPPLLNAGKPQARILPVVVWRWPSSCLAPQMPSWPLHLPHAMSRAQRFFVCGLKASEVRNCNADCQQSRIMVAMFATIKRVWVDWINVTDGERSGRLFTSTTVTNPLPDSRQQRVTIDGVENQLKTSHGSAYEIIHNTLHIHPLSARWVSKRFIEQHRCYRLNICNRHLNRYHEEGDDFLRRNVNSGETWNHDHEPESRRQRRQLSKRSSNQQHEKRRSLCSGILKDQYLGIIRNGVWQRTMHVTIRCCVTSWSSEWRPRTIVTGCCAFARQCQSSYCCPHCSQHPRCWVQKSSRIPEKCITNFWQATSGVSIPYSGVYSPVHDLGFTFRHQWQCDAEKSSSSSWYRFKWRLHLCCSMSRFETHLAKSAWMWSISWMMS